MHDVGDYFPSMESPADRLKQSRVAAGYQTAKQAAQAMGVSVPTYIQHENGTRGFPADRAHRYARFFRTTPEWLLYGRETGDRVEVAKLGLSIPIQGAVPVDTHRKLRRMGGQSTRRARARMLI